MKMTQRLRSGCANSSSKGRSHGATLTSAASKMSNLPNWWAMHSVTSSPASEDGATPYDWLDGPTISPSGPAPARANLSAKPVKAKERKTNATCGLPGLISSESAALQSSLASRLRALLPLPGGTLFQLTWKVRDTPARWPICALRASARRTSGSGSTGWPTTTTLDASNTRNATANRTPGAKKAHAGVTLVDAASWATPAEAGGTPERFLERKEALGGACGVSLTSLSLQAQLSWPTPPARDWKSSASNKHGEN